VAMALVASVTGCSEDDPGFDCTKLPMCDIGEAECQDRVFRATACAREQEGARMPVVRKITRLEFEQELRNDLADPGNGVPVAWETAFRLLGLTPSTPLGDVLIDSAVSNVAAFYRHDNKLVTVIEDNTIDRESASWILSHEFVHALQDQALDLSAFERSWAFSTDDSVAITALIEGEAMIHPNVLQVRARGLSVRSIDWDSYASALLASALETVEKAPSPFVDALSSLPYPVGFRALIERWLAGGQRGIDAVFEQPEFSFLRWLRAFDPGDSRPIEALSCFPTGAPPGFTAFDHDSLGPAAVLGVYVVLGMPGDTALRHGKNLHDDSLVVFTSSPDPVPEGVAVAWRLRFVDAGAADIFVADIRRAAWRGPFDALRVELFDREVLIHGAHDRAVVDAWTNGADCGRVEDLPSPGATSGNMSALVRRTLRGTP
jgi:hypothetical protein